MIAKLVLLTDLEVLAAVGDALLTQPCLLVAGLREAAAALRAAYRIGAARGGEHEGDEDVTERYEASARGGVHLNLGGSQGI